MVETNGRIRTANEGILPGTIRNIIIEECKRENIPIDMSPPVRCVRNVFFFASHSNIINSL